MLGQPLSSVRRMLAWDGRGPMSGALLRKMAPLARSWRPGAGEAIGFPAAVTLSLAVVA